MAEEADSRQIIWVRYTWDLTSPPQNLTIPEGYSARAGKLGEHNSLASVAVASYASDPAWDSLLSGIKDRLEQRIEATLCAQDTYYTVVESGGTVVGVSGVAKSHSTQQNLLTGPCVLPGYQQRGLGAYLLGASLMRLREMDLVQAVVFTQSGCMVDKRVYPKFGSIREEGVTPAYLNGPPA